MPLPVARFRGSIPAGNGKPATGNQKIEILPRVVVVFTILFGSPGIGQIIYLASRGLAWVKQRDPETVWG